MYANVVGEFCYSITTDHLRPLVLPKIYFVFCSVIDGV